MKKLKESDKKSLSLYQFFYKNKLFDANMNHYTLFSTYKKVNRLIMFIV